MAAERAVGQRAGLSRHIAMLGSNCYDGSVRRKGDRVKVARLRTEWKMVRDRNQWFRIFGGRFVQLLQMTMA